MYNMYGMDPSAFGNQETLILNANNTLVKYVFEHQEGEHTNLFCEQLYDFANTMASKSAAPVLNTIPQTPFRLK